MGLTLISPVPLSLALEFAGGKPFLRKVFIHQVRTSDAFALVEDGDPVVLMMLDYQRARRAELALAFAPAAARNMRRFIRFAQLTLREIAQTGTLVYVRIDPVSLAGLRMARLIGLTHGKMRDPAIWFWKETDIWQMCSEAVPARKHGDSSNSPGKNRRSPITASSPS